MTKQITCVGVGRSSQYERALLLHFDDRPSTRDVLRIKALVNNIETLDKMTDRLTALQISQARFKRNAEVAEGALMELMHMPLYRLITLLIKRRFKERRAFRRASNG